MPSRGQAITLSVYAYDTGNSAPKTGDSANISLKLTKDGGTPASPTNALAEVDGTNLPGWYQVLLTAAECTANVVVLGGKSSTSGIVISGTQVTFEQLPTATAAASGGLPTVDASNGVKLSVGTGTGQVNAASGKVPATLASTDVTGNVAADLQTIKTQTVTAAAGVTFPTSVASPTNITAGTIATVTNLTNAPTAGDFTATMKTSLNAATPAATVSDKTGFSLNLSQTGLSPRALDSVADASLTIGDALVAAISSAAGKESVSGTSYVVKTPSTGTVIRTFVLDSSSSPTSRT